MAILNLTADDSDLPLPAPWQEKLIADLARDYSAAGEPTIRGLVQDALDSYSSAPIQTFVPILVERQARQEILSHPTFTGGPSLRLVKPLPE